MQLQTGRDVEIVGSEWGQLVGPLVNLSTSIIGKIGGGKKSAPPPPPPIPWVPISIAGGTAVILITILSMKK